MTDDRPTTDVIADRGFGWRPEFPDVRDYRIARLLGPGAPPPPDSFSFRKDQSPVRNQGAIGSCVGMSTAGAVECLRRKDLDEYSTIYSPIFLYYEARKLQGWVDVDSGCYIRDAVKTAQKVGVAVESHWPYREDRFTDSPSSTAYEGATRWKLGAYFRCDTGPDILKALEQGYPVVGGFVCYSNMFTREVDRTGIVPLPGAEDYVLGGHAVLFTGWDKERKLVEFKNSWGPEWGDGGYGWLPYRYIDDRNMSDDFWCLTEEDESSFRGEAPIYKE